MKIKNLLSVNVLLILTGLALVIIPVSYLAGVVAPDSLEYYSNGGEPVRQAVSDFFNTDPAISADYTPMIDESEIDRSIIPQGVTPQLVANFMVAQARVNYWAGERSAMTLCFFVIIILCVIGVVAGLLGISLFLLNRKLDLVLGGKELIKDAGGESKRKSIFEHNDKTNWKLIVVLLAFTVLIGAGLLIYIKGQQQPFTSFGDGVCDIAIDNVCDPDCPSAPSSYADPDCAKVWQ